LKKQSSGWKDSFDILRSIISESYRLTFSGTASFFGTGFNFGIGDWPRGEKGDSSRFCCSTRFSCGIGDPERERAGEDSLTLSTCLSLGTSLGASGAASGCLTSVFFFKTTFSASCGGSLAFLAFAALSAFRFSCCARNASLGKCNKILKIAQKSKFVPS
jgi:hypothetical protein